MYINVLVSLMGMSGEVVIFIGVSSSQGMLVCVFCEVVVCMMQDMGVYVVKFFLMGGEKLLLEFYVLVIIVVCYGMMFIELIGGILLDNFGIIL